MTAAPGASASRPASRPRWTPRALLYLALAVVGLVGTWTYNVTAVLEKRDYLGDWFGSGPSVSSLTTDLLVVAVAAVIFMIVEGRRVGMRRVWIFIVLAPFVALAFAFPLFLAFRERAIAARDDALRKGATPDGATGER